MRVGEERDVARRLNESGERGEERKSHKHGEARHGEQAGGEPVGRKSQQDETRQDNPARVLPVARAGAAPRLELTCGFTGARGKG